MPEPSTGPPWRLVSSPSQAEFALSRSLGGGSMAGRFAGLLALDHCPIMGEASFGEAPAPSGRLEVKLSPAVALRQLDPLESNDIERVTCQALGVRALPDRLPARDAFRAAHPCAILQIDMPPLKSLREVAELMRHAGPVWLLALSLRVGAECEPIAQVLLDRQNANAEIELYSGFPHAYLAHMNSAWDHCRRAVPGLARDPRLRLYATLFRDFLREPEDSPAILKCWSLLEVMAANETGTKKDMVRALCRRLETHPNGFLLNEMYAAGEDLLDVAYRHRNCVAHEGWCQRTNSGCSSRRWRSGCREARLIRIDLQFLTYGLLRDFLGLSTSWVVGPDGSRLEDRPGVYEPLRSNPRKKTPDVELKPRQWSYSVAGQSPSPPTPASDSTRAPNTSRA